MSSKSTGLAILQLSSPKKSPSFHPLGKPLPFFELFDEHLPHEIAGLDDFGIGNPIVNIEALSTSHDDPPLAQDC